MRRLRHVLHGLRVLLRPAAADRDIDDELRHFVDEAAAAYEAQGLAPAEARRRAAVEAGSPVRVREAVRDGGWERWVAPAAEVVHFGGQSTTQAKAQSLTHLWTSRRRLYHRYHGAAVNAVLSQLVPMGLRRQIRANYRLSQQGRLAADERAELNLALSDLSQLWSGRRRRRGRRGPAAATDGQQSTNGAQPLDD